MNFEQAFRPSQTRISTNIPSSPTEPPSRNSWREKSEQVSLENHGEKISVDIVEGKRALTEPGWPRIDDLPISPSPEFATVPGLNIGITPVRPMLHSGDCPIANRLLAIAC
jgi:hypothetical protein